MATETLIIVVGGDYLAYEICREILKTAGQRVSLIWKHEDERARRTLDAVVSSLSADFPKTFAFHDADPAEPTTLFAAGLRTPEEPETFSGYCVVAVSQNDHLNLRVALLARDINSRVRVTIRQFNPVLGHKIQEGLKYDCTAISPAAHAAATYAASAVDPSCFYALPFPTLEARVAGAIVHSGSLFGFSERRASQFGVGGLTVRESEDKLHARVVAIDGEPPYMCRGDELQHNAALLQRRIDGESRIVVFGPVAHVKDTWPHPPRRILKERWPARLRKKIGDTLIALRRLEPTLRSVLLSAVVLYALFVAFFMWNLHLNVLTAMYFVTTTMTTVGYGDITPCLHCPTQALGARELWGMFVAILMMVAGILVFAVFTATVTSALQAATVRRLRGLRRIDRSGHVIVCGSGNVGSIVVEYLRKLGENVVVVEKNPDAILIELARDRKIDLLTGDATNDETIAYCSPERAKALVGLTNSDTANLEIALGVRTLTKSHGHREFHVVLRIDDPAFGRSIKRHFGIASFSPTELTAPTIAGLARFESTRGRFDMFAGTPHEKTYQLAERLQGSENVAPPPPAERPGFKVSWVPLYVWREVAGGKGVAIPIHKFEGEVSPGDRLLFLVPLDQFHDEER
ncbi:MAG: NAD-binding protein [Candidatus Eremiobacteraeota bacterium]|nr:NAD-binding protein [Candidatus Eremiobacteraeota bacterium]